MSRTISLAILVLLLAGCGAQAPTPTARPDGPGPTVALRASETAGPTATTDESVVPSPTEAPIVSPELTLEPTGTHTPTAEPTLSPTLEPPAPSQTPWIVRVEPTSTPRPGDDRVDLDSLPIGEPGQYVNVTFGYWIAFPPDWFTGFGNRPLLVSLSNLDPGSHNRASMRSEGCLIEVNAASNIYGFTFETLLSQLPKSFPDAELIDLGGEPAMRVKRSSGDNPFEREELYVEHDGRLFVVTFEFAITAASDCRPVWDNMLAGWSWFTPEFAVYRNPGLGYAVSYPRDWVRFNADDRGISISSVDPTGLSDPSALAHDAMIVQTDVLDNPGNLSLKRWVASQDWDIDLTNDIPLEGLIGVRVLRQGPIRGIQEMSGYFQGPRGRIYAVICWFPAGLATEYRPIANAIIYSFEF